MLGDETRLSLQIDGTKEHGLMHRFSTHHFPSIYYITGRETREYLGDRSTAEVGEAHHARCACALLTS